jgi:hypothetical protein
MFTKSLPERLTNEGSCDTLVLVGKVPTRLTRRADMEGIIGTRVATPANPTAWLRDNARKGAMRYTRDGETVYILGAKTTYGDPDKGTEQHPLFAPKGAGTRVYFQTPVVPLLD